MKTIKSKKSIETIAAYNDVTNKINELKKLQSKLRTELLDLRDQKQGNEFRAGLYLVSFKTVERQLFDKKLYLQLNGQNSLDEYLKQTEATTIKIKAA